ncbi:MAG: ABC transporter ATP-binding protein [Actinobacteria bacterium]|nr:ABC transporter ATP-binding protein [Actinomycetota bacterium]
MAEVLGDDSRHGAIVTSGLTKDYGQSRGLFDLDLEIAPGEVFGFIGPNGAGKTTTIRLLMGLIRPDRGSATLLDMDSQRDNIAIKRRVGYLPGELPQFPRLKASHVITLLAGLRGGVDPAVIAGLAERLDIDLGRRYEDLSHGNKQKVGLIQTFMHRPDVIIMDEPTLGLDPLMQREFWRLVQEASSAGSTVLLSSHVLAEVELGCHRMGLIRNGHLLRVGSLEELRTTRVHRVDAIVHDHPDAAGLNAIEGVSEAVVQGDRLSCSVHGSIGPLLAWLAARDVVELDSRELSLEEVFFTELEAE